MDFWSKLLDTSDFPARWRCGQWTEAHGWLHILSDLGIWSAYFAIPCVLTYFALRRKDLPFRTVFWLFGAFILLCGTTHLMEAAIFWWPAYRLAGLIKLLTAIVSWVTIFALIRVAPAAMAMRSPEELEREIAARQTAEAALQFHNDQLEQRVQERTAELAATNAILRSEREWFRTTLTSLGDAVIMTDTNGRVTMLNRVAEQLTGWTPEEAIGQPLPDVFNIINQESRQPVENPAHRALTDGTIVGLANHTVLISRDGAEWFIDDSAAPIKDADGEITGAVLVFRDISERYRSEMERQYLSARLDAFFQNVPIELALFDTDLRFINLNDRAAAVAGIPREEYIGKSVTEVMPQMGKTIEDFLRQVRDSGKSRIDVEVTGTTSSESGESRHWIASYFPIRNSRDAVQCIGAVALEITDRKRAEEQLAYQYSLTRAITDNATTAIVMMDNDSRCTFMNPAAERMTGYSFTEVEGKILHDFIHHHYPDGRPYPLEECPIDHASPEHREVHSHEDVFIRKSGEFFPVLCNAQPLFEDGSPNGAVIEFMDLTEQKLAAARLSESELRFQQLANVIPQLAWTAQPDGHIDWYNNRWYEYTGTTFEDMKGWGWQAVHDPAMLPQVMEHWNASLKTGQPFDMVFPLRAADGTFRPFLTRVVPFRDGEGKIHRWFGTNTDISEQQRIQDELRDLANRLSDADRRKDEFLATLAHEIRNPLAPIRTGLEVMKLAKDDPARIEEIRLTMERQTRQLITLVDDLLDVSRITRGKLELRKCRVKVSEVLRSAVEASQPYLDEARHELIFTAPDESLRLEADPNRLAQVVSNLLTNAAKYTPEGGKVWLSAEPEGDQLRISVRDNGIGIPAEMQSRIFEMFAQIENPMEKGNAGLGIGLTLVKSLVDMHGGVVEVRSEGRHRGSEFIVRLPLEDAAPANSPSNHEPPVTTTPKAQRKVLIVDDNHDAARLLSLIVKMLGNEIRLAGNGEEAIQVAAEFNPEVILMDIGMPRMNGYEAARRIRQEPWGQSMMLVALTGWGQDEDKQRTREAGFDFHLVKPAEPAELQRLLEKAGTSWREE